MIHTPHGLRTRPTQSRLRQALFNSLQTVIADANVLDLFAGSGALGFEALSRGARRAVFVESARPAIKLIQRNAEELGVGDRAEILAEGAERASARLKRLAPFEVALADPPYDQGWEKRLLTELPWGELLAPGGFFCLEWSTEKSEVSELPERVPFLVKTREKNYGDSVLTTYQRSEG